MWFELFRDPCKVTETPWRWRLRNDDGQVIASSASGHVSEHACRAAIKELKGISQTTPVEARQDPAASSQAPKQRARKRHKQT